MSLAPDHRAAAMADAEGATVGALLAEQRQAIAQRLMDGASGTDIVAAQTDLVDGLIIGRYRNAARHGDDALKSAAFQHCCLVALGGYGRREMAPYSDVDLMVLYRPEAAKLVPEFVRQVLHPLWDIGFQVGHSVRTIQDCLSLGLTDVTVRTSMMEARFLTGSPQVFQGFHSAYLRKVATVGVDNYLDLKLQERRREYEKFGETVYLLEPNVKKSKGGLRDLHVLQWAGLARYQAPTIRELSDRAILSRQDYTTVSEAREFLLRVRSLLHERVESNVDFGLAGGRHFVMVLFDLHAALLHLQDHFRADVLLRVGRRHGKVAFLGADFSAQVDAFLAHVPHAFFGVDEVVPAVIRLVVAGLIENEELGFRPPEGLIADLRALQVLLGFLRDVPRIAIIGLTGDRIHHVADQAQGRHGAKGIHAGSRRIRHHEHVAVIDRLPSADGGSVEPRSVLEQRFRQLVDGNAEMLPRADQVHKLQVHDLDFVFLHIL